MINLCDLKEMRSKESRLINRTVEYLITVTQHWKQIELYRQIHLKKKNFHLTCMMTPKELRKDLWHNGNTCIELCISSRVPLQCDTWLMASWLDALKLQINYSIFLKQNAFKMLNIYSVSKGCQNVRFAYSTRILIKVCRVSSPQAIVQIVR